MSKQSFKLPFGRASAVTTKSKSILLPPSSAQVVTRRAHVSNILETNRPRAKTWRPTEVELAPESVDDVEGDPYFIDIVQQIQRCVLKIKEAKQDIDRAYAKAKI